MEQAEASAAAEKLKPKRDDWMLLPPTSGDWSSRVDPTKLKNRKFNTSKGAKGPASSGGNADGISEVWTETPEQKLQRLKDETLGTKLMSGEQKANDVRSAASKEEAEQMAKRIREYNVSHFRSQVCV
jgi:hypothetical protein